MGAVHLGHRPLRFEETKMKITLYILGYLAVSFAVCCFIGKMIKFGGSTSEE